MVTLDMVKQLREKTGAPMGDCKKALEQSGGDMESAIEFLRKKGAASAAKRADRVANEGMVYAVVSADGKQAAIVEVNCETDFVGRNEQFGAFVRAIADAILATGAVSGETLWNYSLGDKTLGNLRDETLLKFNERIELRRAEYLQTTGTLTAYNHAGNRLAVVVEVNATIPPDTQLLRDLAMQIAAMNPQYISREDVPAEVVAKELEIGTEQALQDGKKPEIAERIARGRLEKFYQEQCLLEQMFVKDSAKTVADVVKQLGEGVAIVRFLRYALGEAS
ncbi:MAG: translation elongation factor Ts [Bacteroidota bacterium]|nr:translation elongation factor Ts [Candidatus Kapabacteria bacterium]MCS7302668.1 translation elongation factor Ts [Candidatus Kapabacteria bacterium]MCX7936176.1 translation elongation factor Ts [Chlorobiota bacterium]MDW8074930.1 translation elongation factor Ts [Bacteroidota bacterium]MDW8271569.1 translation elongation factor Ts [Bacteroidota bacterium]